MTNISTGEFSKLSNALLQSANSMLTVLHYSTDISYMEVLKAVRVCWSNYLLDPCCDLARDLDHLPYLEQPPNDYEIDTDSDCTQAQTCSEVSMQKT